MSALKPSPLARAIPVHRYAMRILNPLALTKRPQTVRSPCQGASLIFRALLAWTWLTLLFLTVTSAPAWQMKQAPLMTQWASQIDTNNPLPEYPRPQLVRNQWLSLNGIWQFQAGELNDPIPTNQPLASEILVPFPMESAISGVRSEEHTS